jgi:hypothetical protein
LYGVCIFLEWYIYTYSGRLISQLVHWPVSLSILQHSDPTRGQYYYSSAINISRY